MTEYWKSNARKFCDYCKCWFADNRPSIEFHQAGKKHKENVAKRLQEIGKRGQEDYENSLRVDDYMKQMEQAALAAYKDDIGNNPDMTGSAIAVMAQDKNADIIVKGQQQPPKPPPPPPPSDSKWHQAKSSEGHFYYYHVDTKETKWEAPPGGFLSIEDQKKLKALKKAKKKNKEKQAAAGESSKVKDKPKNKEAKAEASAPRSNTDTAVPRPSAEAPALRPSAETTAPSSTTDSTDKKTTYGSWVTVEKPVMPDLQLPVVPGYEEDEEADFYASLPRDAPHQFTQKTVTLAGTASGTGFKKRKNCDTFKKNARVRNNDL